MKLSTAVLAATVGLAAGHGMPGVPHIVGGKRFLQELRGRRAMADFPVEQREPEAEHSHPKRQSDPKAPRANTSGKCGAGAGAGNCADGYCCSADGWCGTGTTYCAAPDCQINYGPACDGNQAPTGVSTASVARTKFGSIAYSGNGIYSCSKVGDIALTFDDGPYLYTGDLLDKLKSYGVPATFMITGNNLGKGMINDATKPWAGYIKRMIAEGHQIVSHTWSHQNASQLTTTQMQNQMYYNEIAFNDILGFFPTYMRPPFSICPAIPCQSVMTALGYHVIYFDLDTQGYLNDSPTLIQNSKNIWNAAMAKATPAKNDFLLIEHDIHYQTVYNLTDYIITSLLSYGYNPVTLGQCLGDDPANWYRDGSGTAPTTYTYPSATGKASTGGTGDGSGTTPSVDGTCGGSYTCAGTSFGTCCSEHGYCGSTSDYCGDGCQSAFGSCGAVSSGANTATVVTTTVYVTVPAGGTTTKTSTTSAPPVSPSKTSTTTVYVTRTTTGTTAVHSTSTTTSTSTRKTVAPTTTALRNSTDGSCGAAVGLTCVGYNGAPCCGSDNKCEVAACLSSDCQSAYGLCLGSGGLVLTARAAETGRL